MPQFVTDAELIEQACGVGFGSHDKDCTGSCKR
jgi:hypothetical protein